MPDLGCFVVTGNECPQCGKYYKYIRGLRRHLQECGKSKRFFCHLCSHKTHRKENLKVHMVMKHNCY